MQEDGYRLQKVSDADAIMIDERLFKDTTLGIGLQYRHIRAAKAERLLSQLLLVGAGAGGRGQLQLQLQRAVRPLHNSSSSLVVYGTTRY